MLGYGLFLAILFLIPGALGVLLIRGLERIVAGRLLQRGLAGLIAALVAGRWMLGAGWYIAAGFPLLVMAVLLGALAGGWLSAIAPPACERVCKVSLQPTSFAAVDVLDRLQIAGEHEPGTARFKTAVAIEWLDSAQPNTVVNRLESRSLATALGRLETQGEHLPNWARGL